MQHTIILLLSVCTLTADISCDMVEQLFDSCCLLMQSKIKQISTAALSFVKVLLVAFDIEVGRQHLRNVVSTGSVLHGLCHTVCITRSVLHGLCYTACVTRSVLHINLPFL